MAYRIQRRNPRMSGGFSAVATGRWRTGLALALVAGVALGIGRVVLRDRRAARRGRP